MAKCVFPSDIHAATFSYRSGTRPTMFVSYVHFKVGHFVKGSRAVFTLKYLRYNNPPWTCKAGQGMVEGELKKAENYNVLQTKP